MRKPNQVLLTQCLRVFSRTNMNIDPNLHRPTCLKWMVHPKDSALALLVQAEIPLVDYMVRYSECRK